jgi:oxygen-independent coproporphyrinogen-3 oxidase
MSERRSASQGEESHGFGLYIHWPFCRSKCPYCDFNSHVRESIDERRWRCALLAELEHFAQETGGRALTSIFFGGGTPSLMSPATTAALIDRAASLWRLAPEIEVTLEANPTSVEADRFRDFRSAGVNRVSLGVQSLDDAALRFLGRRHDAGEALAAIGLARKNFPRWSFDLIYARPGQDEAAWEAELRRALPLVGDHLSVYQLTIEPGTAFETAHRRGDFSLPDEDRAASLFELTQHVLDAEGLPAYEISNHARPGGECRHNLVYWRYEDYVGAGPGAHGRLTVGSEKFATRQLRAPETWLAAVEAHGHGTQERLRLTVEEQLEEQLMMGMRLAEGVSRGRLAGPLDGDRIEQLVEGGFVVADEERLAATAAGRQRLNAVLGALVG